jgi:heat shock transcription factor
MILIVLNPEKLTHDLIPRFFKHSNYASFVRQLNMYGFRKVSHVLQGALKSSTPDVTEFQNPNFIRGRPDLLEHVKRKTAGKKADSDVMDASEGQASSLTAVSGKDKIPSVELVLAELSNIKKTQQKIQNELRTIHQENEHIWKESQAQRLKHESQQVVINKVRC